jgi:hypothetical protein
MSGLDELPQLINVFRGEMSLVGPRPEMPFIVDGYSPLERQRLRVKPGITGLWQLSADRHAEIHENIEYDLYYIDHRSLMMDALILLETVFFTTGLVLSAPRRRSAEDYQPAMDSSDHRDGSESVGAFGTLFPRTVPREVPESPWERPVARGVDREEESRSSAS